jgi:hypothetical protein
MLPSSILRRPRWRNHSLPVAVTYNLQGKVDARRRPGRPRFSAVIIRGQVPRLAYHSSCCISACSAGASVASYCLVIGMKPRVQKPQRNATDPMNA